MPEAQSQRCFIALEVPRDIQAQLGRMIAGLRAADADVKWVDPANIHLTLKFLGEIPPEQVTGASAQLEGLRGRYQKIPLRLTGLGAFPNIKRPQTIWAGIEIVPELIGLYHDIESRMSAIGFPGEQRAFKPHLTLGRVRSLRNAHHLTQAIAESQIMPLQSAFSALILFRSTLKPAGPIYQPLTTIELG